MQKMNCILTAAVLCMAVLSGCAAGESNADSSTAAQSTQSSTQTSEASAKEGEVITDYAIVEFAEVADSLKTLTENADWIAKVQVSSPSATEDGFTQFVPKILELYKGDDTVQTLTSVDCIMPYAGTSESQSADSRTEDEASAMYYCNHAGNYIPQDGDILLFFGMAQDNGTYTEEYSYQGMFLLQDGSYHNQALNLDTEPLAADLKTLSGAKRFAIPAEFTRTENGISYTFQNRNAYTVSVPEQAMIDVIQSNLDGTV